jgi:solute carrier family 25 carnitine/acylcarnitine transporter 20/29
VVYTKVLHHRFGAWVLLICVNPLLYLFPLAMFGFFGESRKWVALWKKKSVTDLTIPEVCIAGGITGVLISAIVVPVEQVKARLQIQYALPPGVKPQYTGALDCCRQLVRNNGILGMFRGYPATIMTRGHCWAYFGGQEIARQFYVKRSGKSDYKLSSFEQFMSGGFSGTCYWIIAYPFDVVKNRLMSQPDVKPLKYPSVISAWKHIWKVDGIRGFGVGFIPAAMRTLPANGITWLALQYVQDVLERFDPIFDK